MTNCDSRLEARADAVWYVCKCGYESDILGPSPLVLDVVSLDRKHFYAVRQQREDEPKL